MRRGRAWGVGVGGSNLASYISRCKGETGREIACREVYVLAKTRVKRNDPNRHYKILFGGYPAVRSSCYCVTCAYQ